jgi:hypothetical protein
MNKPQQMSYTHVRCPPRNVYAHTAQLACSVNPLHATPRKVSHFFMLFASVCSIGQLQGQTLKMEPNNETKVIIGLLLYCSLESPDISGVNLF